MMQKIITRNEYDVKDHGLLIEEKQVGDPKYFLSYPSCHKSNNDCFIDQLANERSIGLTSILDDIIYIDDFPKFAEYDDDFDLQTEENLAEKSTVDLWEEEFQFQQLEYNDQLMHITYGSEEESVENFEASEGSLAICFVSFQFIKQNFYPIRNYQSLSFDVDNEEQNEILDKDSSDLDFQPPYAIECWVADEDLETQIYDQMMEENSLPLCFETFHLLKRNFHSISAIKNEQLIENYEVSLEPMCNRCFR